MRLANGLKSDPRVPREWHSKVPSGACSGLARSLFESQGKAGEREFGDLASWG